MRTKERTDINAKVLSLKQASVVRVMAAARDAMTNGALRTCAGANNRPQTRELRVKTA